MLFSVLIPVYNAEEYLERSVESALKQTFQGEFEIIILDDGSTDRSYEIAQKLQNKNPDRIQLVRQVNAGAYKTRRRLARAATGEYLFFLDCDDELKTDALECVYNVVNTNRVDLVLFDLIKTDVSEDEVFTLPFDDGQIFRVGEKYQLYMLKLTTKLLNSMCTKVIKKSCIDLEESDGNLKFYTGEDAYQSYPIIDRANTIMYKKKILYIYHKNADSQTGKLSYKLFYSSLDALLPRVARYMDKWMIKEEDRKCVYKEWIASYCNCAISAVNDNTSISEKVSFLSMIKSNIYFNEAAKIAGSSVSPFLSRGVLWLVLNGRFKLLRIFVVALNTIRKVFGR